MAHHPLKERSANIEPAGTKKLEQLATFLQYPAAKLLGMCSQARIPLMVVHTWRDPALQLQLYKKGRTFEGGMWLVVDKAAVVTNAMPGQTAHNVMTRDRDPASLAMDLMLTDRKGQPLWLLTKETTESLMARWTETHGTRTEAQVWGQVYEYAAKCGFDPYGDKWGASLPSDKGHFEEPGWKFKLTGLGLRMGGSPDPAGSYT